MVAGREEGYLADLVAKGIDTPRAVTQTACIIAYAYVTRRPARQSAEPLGRRFRKESKALRLREKDFRWLRVICGSVHTPPPFFFLFPSCLLSAINLFTRLLRGGENKIRQREANESVSRYSRCCFEYPSSTANFADK